MPKNGVAILNTDIAEYEKLFALCRKRKLKTITFGKAGKNIRLLSIIPKDGAQDIHLLVGGKPYQFTLPFVGQFQVYNVMAALGAVIACGGDREKAVNACSHLNGVPGRLEKIVPGVYVDYSHTPDGLFLALRALRPHTKGKLWVVFGCGGERDPFKRPMMGEIAHKLADKIIITDDNPRHEDPAKIRQEILAKCPRASESTSREQAIQSAIEGMEPDDVLLLAGKGHETYQIVGDEAIPFNDSEEVRKYVRK
jgi:UDP-N-acetylmuramoyl-L-alanyl-D-glutamate--2,6-diaminopimelate ligase